jgi:hypothetical protein
MALANARGFRESSVKSQLRGIVRSGLPPHANLLFFCANRANVISGSAAKEAFLLCLCQASAAGKSKRENADRIMKLGGWSMDNQPSERHFLSVILHYPWMTASQPTRRCSATSASIRRPIRCASAI